VSLKSIDSDKAFRAWKADIEARAAAYVREHPELGAPAAHPAAIIPINPRVTMCESDSVQGVWSVYLDGGRLNTFFGHDAYQKASEYYRQMLKKYQ
jgi:hypothetical protein